MTLATKPIYAGNVVRIVSTLTRPAGSTTSVNPSTAKVCVTTPAGVSTAIASVVTYNVDNSAVIVTADWVTADTLAGGVYTITVDTSGNLVAADEQRILILPRREPVVP